MTSKHPLITALQPIISRVRTDATAVRQPDGIVAWTEQPLTDARLLRHFDSDAPRGCCPIKPGHDSVMLALFDLDSHKGEVPWPEMAATADRLAGVLEARGLYPIAFRSGGGNGIHLFLVWDQMQDAYSVRVTMAECLAEIGHTSGTGGLAKSQIEIFPKQNSVPEGKFGNMFVLPYTRASVPLSTSFEPLPIDAPVKWPASDPVPLLAPPERSYTSGTTPTELKQLQAALQAIPQEDAPLDYDQWRNVIFGIHHETEGSDEGLALAHEFSARSGKYDPDFLDNRVWPYITSDRNSAVTGRSILHLAREHGYVEDVSDAFDDISDAFGDISDATPASKTEVKVTKFAPIHASQFTDAPPTQWLVKDILPAGWLSATLAVMYGASGSGKSFEATDMACAIALGIPWRGHKTAKGRVVYICAEGAGGYRKRLKAYAKHHGLDIADLDVWVIPAAPNLLQKDDIKALVEAIRAVGPIALIVVDTLAQATAGGNENSGEDMGMAIGHCRTLSEVLHCTVMLIHHSGKDDTKGARGHSSLKAAADTELEVVRADDRRAMRVSKQKDGEEGQDMGFELKTITLGHDEDGDPITSCVVVHNGDTVADVRNSKADNLGEVELVIINLVEATFGLTGDSEMDLADLTEQAKEAIPQTEGKRDQRRTRVKNALNRLLQRGKLVSENGKVRIA